MIIKRDFIYTPKGTNRPLHIYLPDDYDNVTYPLTTLGWDLGEQINPIMYSAKEWEASRITPFYQNVVQDAIVLT